MSSVNKTRQVVCFQRFIFVAHVHCPSHLHFLTLWTENMDIIFGKNRSLNTSVLQWNLIYLGSRYNVFDPASAVAISLFSPVARRLFIVTFSFSRQYEHSSSTSVTQAWNTAISCAVTANVKALCQRKQGDETWIASQMALYSLYSTLLLAKPHMALVKSSAMQGIGCHLGCTQSHRADGW
jgi:hypothetical protein